MTDINTLSATFFFKFLVVLQICTHVPTAVSHTEEYQCCEMFLKMFTHSGGDFLFSCIKAAPG